MCTIRLLWVELRLHHAQCDEKPDHHWVDTVYTANKGGLDSWGLGLTAGTGAGHITVLGVRTAPNGRVVAGAGVGVLEVAGWGSM